jgi:hypothetical protein
MNATFDGARIHQQELDREIDTILAEEMLSAQAPHHPGPASRAIASVGRGLISGGTALASRVDAPAGQSAESGGRA